MPLALKSQFKKKIFIDGSHGTTGLELSERLKKNTNFTLIEIPFAKRKDIQAKESYYKKADLVVLCLPDHASEKAVRHIEKIWYQRGQEHPKILDTSTLFRTYSDWVYGHPQLWPQRIISSSRVANPGCYAIGFVTLVYPLIKMKLTNSNHTLTVFGGSGYSGGGKKMIETYENTNKRPPILPYALDLEHKHLREMKLITGLKKTPIFLPMVGSYYRGMIMMLPLPYSHIKSYLKKKMIITDKPKKTIGSFLKKFYSNFYRKSKVISVQLLKKSDLYQEKILSPIIDGDNLEIIISVRKNGDAMLFARLDNLGKGAAGNVMENIQLMMQSNKSHKN